MFEEILKKKQLLEAKLKRKQVWLLFFVFCLNIIRKNEFVLIYLLFSLYYPLIYFSLWSVCYQVILFSNNNLFYIILGIYRESNLWILAFITFLIVSFYESLDFITLCQQIKDDRRGILIIGLSTALLAFILQMVGDNMVNDDKIQNYLITVAGNLIGYALILIIVSPMKRAFGKWMKEREKRNEKKL